MIQDIGTAPYVTALEELMNHLDKMSPKEAQFVQDMFDKSQHYKDRVRISEGQRLWIAGLVADLISQEQADRLTGQLRLKGV